MQRNHLKKSLLGAVCAGLMAVMLLPGAAEAKKPLDVDCDVLASTLTAIDAFLPSGTFDSLGDLISQTKTDPTTFAILNALVGAFSGGTISFADATEAPPTIAKCGLMSTFVGQVRD